MIRPLLKERYDPCNSTPLRNPRIRVGHMGFWGMWLSNLGFVSGRGASGPGLRLYAIERGLRFRV